MLGRTRVWARHFGNGATVPPAAADLLTPSSSAAADSVPATRRTPPTTHFRLRNHRYSDDYLKVPSDTKSFSKTGGGYWIAERKLPPHTQFTATTTYRAETLAGPDTAASQLQRSEGLVSTLVGYEAARQTADMRRSISADPRARAEATARGIGTQTVRPGSGGSILDASSPFPRHRGGPSLAETTGRPATVSNACGELPGYQTTYGNMTDKTCRDLAQSLQTRPATSSPPGDPRFKVLPRVMVAGMARNGTTYGSDFGPDGHDPMAREPPSKDTMTRLSTTRGLAHGTTRNVSHIPRYTGHIPASQYNTDEAKAQGAAAEPRPDLKAQALPYRLDQYPRGRLPGYTGFKPQAACNVDTKHNDTLPSMATTAGEAGLRGTAFGVPEQDHCECRTTWAGAMLSQGYQCQCCHSVGNGACVGIGLLTYVKYAWLGNCGWGAGPVGWCWGSPDMCAPRVSLAPAAHYINSRAGLMTFFNGSMVGTEFVSDNGLFNAQVYYKHAKSQGTLGIKTAKPSAVTHYGATFRAAASMV